MNLTKKITLALGLLAAGTSFAQTHDAEVIRNGLLGQRYAEFSFGVADIEEYSDNGYGTGVAFNLPVLASRLDVGGSYTYSWVRGPLRGHANSVNTYATAYVPLEGVKPFVSANLGYEWTSLPFGYSEKLGTWGLAAGVEIPVGALTFTPRIGYSDDFENGFNDGDVWTYEIEANYWFTPRAAAFASVAKVDFHRDPIDVWTYEAGIRFRF